MTGDAKYGTEDNIVGLEDQHIRAYVALTDLEQRTAFFPASRFHYEAERDIYLCPAGKELRFDRPHSTERQLRYRARQRLQPLPTQNPMYHEQTGPQSLSQRA